jgi:hypothetical protein
MKRNDGWEGHKEKKMDVFHASLLERQDRTTDLQECTSMALLDNLRQGLLTNFLINT